MKALNALTAVSLLVSSSLAAFDITSKANVVVYYGQGAYQVDLINYCQQPSIDVIVLSFVIRFPAQANGYPGTNFGNRCTGTAYSGPGYNGVVNHTLDSLMNDCPTLRAQIPICQQTYGKKILLSLGGGMNLYDLEGAQDGQTLANQLWMMFGPQNKGWLQMGGPRPFDNGTQEVVVDGFDLDIEYPPDDNFVGYTTFASHLHSLFRLDPRRQYLLTATPQCVVPDANMAAILQAAPFDLVFVQFYNTPQCSAVTWALANPIFAPGEPFALAGFTFNAWTTWLAGTISANAKVFLGLAGNQTAAVQTPPGNFVNATQAMDLIDAFYCNPMLGGVAVWDATRADMSVFNDQPYYLTMKRNLLAARLDPRVQTCAPSY